MSEYRQIADRSARAAADALAGLDGGHNLRSSTGLSQQRQTRLEFGGDDNDDEFFDADGMESVPSGAAARRRRCRRFIITGSCRC